MKLRPGIKDGGSDFMCFLDVNGPRLMDCFLLARFKLMDPVRSPWHRLM